MRPKFHWVCPRCNEAQLCAKQDLCPACVNETKGQWKRGALHAHMTQAERFKYDSIVGL